MAEAFTAGVKPGGLTDDTQIRILLCYMIKTSGPLNRDTLQGALLQEQLVNYFEFADALVSACQAGVHILAYDCHVGRDSLTLHSEIPVLLR